MSRKRTFNNSNSNNPNSNQKLNPRLKPNPKLPKAVYSTENTVRSLRHLLGDDDDDSKSLSAPSSSSSSSSLTCSTSASSSSSSSSSTETEAETEAGGGKRRQIMTSCDSKSTSTPAHIAGYYFDPTTNKYFRCLPNSSLPSRPSNSIVKSNQKKPRNLHASRRSVSVASIPPSMRLLLRPCGSQRWQQRGRGGPRTLSLFHLVFQQQYRSPCSVFPRDWRSNRHSKLLTPSPQICGDSLLACAFESTLARRLHVSSASAMSRGLERLPFDFQDLSAPYAIEHDPSGPYLAVGGEIHKQYRTVVYRFVSVKESAFDFAAGGGGGDEHYNNYHSSPPHPLEHKQQQRPIDFRSSFACEDFNLARRFTLSNPSMVSSLCVAAQSNLLCVAELGDVYRPGSVSLHRLQDGNQVFHRDMQDRSVWVACVHASIRNGDRTNPIVSLGCSKGAAVANVETGHCYFLWTGKSDVLAQQISESLVF